MFYHFRSYLLSNMASQITTRAQAITFEHVLRIWQIMFSTEYIKCGIKGKILDNQNSLRVMRCPLFWMLSFPIFESHTLIKSHRIISLMQSDSSWADSPEFDVMLQREMYFSNVSSQRIGNSLITKNLCNNFSIKFCVYWWIWSLFYGL